MITFGQLIRDGVESRLLDLLQDEWDKAIETESGCWIYPIQNPHPKVRMHGCIRTIASVIANAAPVEQTYRICNNNYCIRPKHITKEYVRMAHFADAIFNSDKIREIQLTELSEIKGLSIEALSNRIAAYESATRELALRMVKAKEELHRRLSEKDSSELEHLIERVPAAEGTLRNRQTYEPTKPKAPTFADKVNKNLKSVSRSDPKAKAFLESLMALKK